MAIQVFNTLTRKKEPYEPVRSDMTGFYVCGPTVYDYFHIGNARPFIVFDVIRRYLIFRGYNVRYVMNLTDIDDKIIRRANEEGVSTDVIAQRYINAFFEDIQKLGVRPADVYPRATQHVQDIIDLIQKLFDRGFAYESGGDVFFDVSRFPNYARLSGKKIDELMSGARIAVDERKRNPLDFVLWKASKPGEPKWESPWGPGRPGWHIECSVMSMKYLGDTFDFHAGGMDLIFPHHENEIAQSQAATGGEFAHYWLHNGFLDIHGEKMAKSLGNFITARQLAERYRTAAIRLFFLQKHYRSPIDFTEEAMDAASTSVVRLATSYQRFVEAAGDAAPILEPEPQFSSDTAAGFWKTLESLRREALELMDDDFNTSAATGKIFDLIRETNRFIERGIQNEEDRRLVATARTILDEFDSFLGIIDRGAVSSVDEEKIDQIVQILLQMRQRFRQEKNYALADEIRAKLGEAGVVVEDTPKGPVWRWKN